MPIEMGLWRLGEKLTRIAYSPIDTERRLEHVLADDITIADPGLLLIGRQVPTAFGKFIDLLALDPDGNVVVLELKKEQTARHVVAQLLDYGSWVRSLGADELAGIFERHQEKHAGGNKRMSLDEAFCQRFNVPEFPENLNQSHTLVVVAAELDPSTERIIGYLAKEYGVPINAVFFRFFRDGEAEYLSRAWLIDPGEVEASAVERRENLPWNGEFYVSFGGSNPNRDWEEARRYGFVSAGGGAWYTRTLGLLEPGGRIWVNMPGGIGYVVEPAVPIDVFQVEDGKGGHVPITSLPLKAASLVTEAQDPEKAEHVVRVEWIKTVPATEAVPPKGLFGNQNSAARPTSTKWAQTVERLKAAFGVSD